MASSGAWLESYHSGDDTTMVFNMSNQAVMTWHAACNVSSREWTETMIDQVLYGANYSASAARSAGHLPVYEGKSSAATAADTSAPEAAESAGPGMGFLSLIKGLIDIVNPLQHIPVISTLYRRITGDEISPM